MKRLFMQLCLLAGLSFQLNAQQYDDGYVSSSLRVNTNTEKFQSFVKGIMAGVDNVAAGVLHNNDDIVRMYGIDLLKYPRLDQIVADGNNDVYGNRFSTAFLQNLQQLFSRVGTEYDNVLSVRTALRNMTSFTSANAYEAEALAAIDISIQEVNRRFLTTYDMGSVLYGQPYQFAAGRTAGLPAWARCALGVIGEAILGGISGGRIGSLLGGALGGALGGIIGVIGGAFSGAAKYC